MCLSTKIMHGLWGYDYHKQAWEWRRAPVVSQQERVRKRPEVNGIAQRGRGYRRPARRLPRPPMERAPQRSSGLPQPAHVRHVCCTMVNRVLVIVVLYCTEAY